ncbi:MAG: GAF domain-containing protein [Anaerolineales bacterium]|nr:GAF domain-containing protein [Anaerolineales bacterium]
MRDLIGMLDEDKLRVMANQGFDERMENLPDQTMKIELPAMLLAVETGQPQRLSVSASREKLTPPTAHTQMIIPIRRETAVIGLLHLESTSDSQVDIAFLTRLAGSCRHCHFQCAAIWRSSARESCQEVTLFRLWRTS